MAEKKKSAKKKTKKPSKKSLSTPKADKLKHQIDELTDDLKRIQADFTNYKRRSEQERERAVAIGREATVTTLLPVIDNLQRAMQQVPADLADNSYVKGIGSVAKQLHETLLGIGVKKIECEGKEFDPEIMEAVAYDDGDGEREVVIEELQAGYEMNGNVIRHAMVKVGRK